MKEVELPLNKEPRITSEDEAVAAALIEGYDKLRAEVGKFIVGQEAVVEEVLIAVLAGGHCLLEGVPGLAKTLLVKTVSATIVMFMICI